MKSAGLCIVQWWFANGVEQIGEFYVVPELNYHLVFGMPWLKAANPVIDW